MNRESVVDELKRQLPVMADRFGVASLAVFGSAVTDSLRADSDVDILASFEGTATFDRYFGLKRFLEDCLGRPVDLATPNMLKPRIRHRIEANVIRVA